VKGDGHSLSQGTDFLLRCCRPVDESVSDLAGFSGSALDWRWIERAARHQGVTPLVARRLELLTPRPREFGAVANLLTSARANTLRNDFLCAELARLFAEFGKAGIAALAVKGPVLGAIAYGDPALRVFNDLDMLVPERDTPRAAALLEALKYTAETYSDEAMLSGFFNAVEASFRRDDMAAAVDLHWRLSPRSYPFGPDGEEVWERATRVPLGGVPIPTLAHEDHLLYVCVHASRHGWQSLSNVCDVAQLIARTLLDWPRVIERARRTRCFKMLAVGLTLANRLLGAEIPAEAKEAIGPGPISRLSLSLISEFLSDPIGGPGPVGEVLRSMRSIEGVAEKLNFLLKRPAISGYSRLWRWRAGRWPGPGASVTTSPSFHERLGCELMGRELSTASA
jgi:hypothetical protein